MGKQIVLEGEGIATGYRQGKQVAEVHQGLDFCLSGGELTCLLGCNGAGKSTLLRTLAGMQPPLSGRLELMGRPLEAYSAHERSKTIGVVLTDRMQAGGLTVYELVALGRQPYTGFFRTFDFCRQSLGMAGVGRGRHGRKGASLCGRTVRRGASESHDCQGAGTRMPVDSLGRAYGFSGCGEPYGSDAPAPETGGGRTQGRFAFHARCGSGFGHVRPLMADDAGTRDAVWDDRGLGAVGAMDRLFGSTSIRFDAVRGIYAPENRNSRVVRLEAADEALRYWAQNLLVRHGFRPVAPDEGGEGAASLAVISPHDMVWTQNGISSRFCSFAGLAEMFRPS